MAKNPIPLGYPPGQGPSIPFVILLCIALAVPCLLISYVIFHGLPNGMFSFGKNKLPVKGRTIVITGGSQGMGLELGNVFSHKGANVVLVARNSAKLEKAVAYIKQAALNPDTQRFHWISADVTDPAENDRVITEVTTWNNGSPPDIVWANAGAAVPGYFLDMPVETLRSQMDLNYWAAIYMARTIFKTWLDSPVAVTKNAKGQGLRPAPRHFIMTSSTAAFCGLAGYTGYSPTKAALRSFHDQMRSELQLYNGYLGHVKNTTMPKIKIHTVFPGTIDSPGLVLENQSKPTVLHMLEKGDPVQKPIEIAMEAIRQLEQGRSMVTTNFLGHLMKGGSLMGSIRDSPVGNLGMSWLANLVWLWVAPDMEGKVQNFSKANGMPEKRN